MKTSLQKLQKFFRLESGRDFDNRAVMGGLENMLEPWEAEARADSIPEEIIQAVTTRLRDYGRLSPDSRGEVLKGLWERIKRETDNITASSIGQSKPKTTPTKQQRESKSKSKAKPETKPRDHKTKTTKQVRTIKARPKLDGPPAALDAPVTVLDGVGPANAEKLSRLEINNLGDMLYHFPRRYDDYSKLKPINRLEYGEVVTIIGTVQSVNSRPIHKTKSKLTEVIVNDGSGAIRMTWFNQPWLSKSLKEGAQVVLSGKIEQYLGRLNMTNPEWELLEEEHLHTNRIVPVYPLTAKITQRWLRRLMKKVVSYWALRVQDPLPESVIKSANLIALSEALIQVHFPDSKEALKEAQHRLAFDEIFLLQIGVLRQKKQWQERRAQIFEPPTEWLETQLNNLPYTLTTAQKKVLENVKQDLASGHPMNRLLQGDVGSGKTVIAALGIAIVTRQGSQAAIMAPTSILAEQHYNSLLKLLAEEHGALSPNQIRLILGSTPESEKQELRSQLENGEIKVLVGTHALIEEPVKFTDLQLTIIDEQHRFGVKQRAALRAKGDNPHLMVMTATPIPRTLALTVYGDLDLAVIDEMPPGRQPVETHALYPKERERAYALIKSQLESGHQAFVIYPLVEESEKSASKAAVEEQTRLQGEIFPTYKVGLLHGRLKADEKENAMARFRDQEYHIMVSTTVVEVGVDIPNATVMLIEGANRFGLAQLHQLRGRVGRGSSKAFCLMIPETDDDVENERLTVMSETNDGFVLAERDLEQRGPGQFLGTRQSGFSELRVAVLSDMRLIEKARKHAQDFISKDPELEYSEHQLLAKTLKHFWEDGQGDLS
ncbi:MAG: ATP-dependent DNA helicase RecG [Chloroflexi bacterium]|nr:ATP-dependent DNA helicase RecG [Chloroflexota bacterium]